jgi:hypothetical protein
MIRLRVILDHGNGVDVAAQESAGSINMLSLFAMHHFVLHKPNPPKKHHDPHTIHIRPSL